MKKLLAAMCVLAAAPSLTAEQWILPGGDTLSIYHVTDGAVRVRIGSNPLADKYLYGGNAPREIVPANPRVFYSYNPETGRLVFDNDEVVIPVKHFNGMLGPGATFDTPADEHQYGLGQFQDGYLDIKGLSRRLTQVNTQISLPMIISNSGYGILWNNCGYTEFNPPHAEYLLRPVEGAGETVSVDATSTHGNVREERSYNAFACDIDIMEDGDYSLLVDVGQPMARKHYLAVDGEVYTRADNLWLPPTTSVNIPLKAGKHHVEVRGEKNDRPTLQVCSIDGSTTFSSETGPVDYIFFAGTPDQIIADMRQLTGQVPMPPKWAFGYVHCRERYTSQDDILDNASEFREREIPLDVIVQDWQWWGDNGWNAMEFDHKNYPDPKALTDSLHAMDVRMMLSVWAKVDKNSRLGRELEAKGSYIPGTDWIDFFSDQAAEDYWQAYKAALVPTGIDSWWQDATEPENDDLHGRMVAAGTLEGDAVRNVFPIVVNDRVYRGLLQERPGQRPLILTRSAAPGLQRYGAFTWSGDVGNDWQTLQRQISGGLGQMAAGVPWWTYDAGGFFRPGDQYNNADYQDRMTRWIQNAVYLPMMRVHGYMSRTEPWHYSPDTYERYETAVTMRYRLLPYIYSEAVKVSTEGSTLLRPLVFDFPDDEEALKLKTQYMLGQSVMVCPVTEDGDNMLVYLPEVEGGWRDLITGEAAPTGYSSVELSPWYAPAYVKGGTILPLYQGKMRSSADIKGTNGLGVYSGADGEYTLYDDNGVDDAYLKGEYLKIPMRWDDKARVLTIGANQGSMPNPGEIIVKLDDREPVTVLYDGTETRVSL